MRMLIAEDGWALGAFLTRVFGEDGYAVTLARNGDATLALARTSPPDIAVVEQNLQGHDGLEVLDALHAAGAAVVMLTDGGDAQARVRCLEAGADDVMQKPLSPAELRARCRVLLRRRAPGRVLRNGEVELDRVARVVRRRGEAVALTNREYALLEYLMEHGGEAVSREALLERVWGRKAGVRTNVVDVYINYLRRKLDGGAPVIRTVRGVGYAIGWGA